MCAGSHIHSLRYEKIDSKGGSPSGDQQKNSDPHDVTPVREPVQINFILGGGEVAVEVKGSAMVDKRAFRPMKTFIELYKPRQAIVICTEKEERLHDDIRVMPWRIFLQQLWQDKIIK